VAIAAPAAPKDVAAIWKLALDELHRSRPMLAAALDHAEVSDAEGSAVTLSFRDRFTLEQTEKNRAELERALEAVARRAIKVSLRLGAAMAGATAPTPGAPIVKATVAVEAEAAEAERQRREAEARNHPIVQKAQDVFGVGVREIKPR
jgi:hypothetical protein